MPGILCEHCTGFCCRYLALPIEAPETKREFDDIRWYLMHENVSVFVEDGEWYINISTTCRHLKSDNMCGVYETRPQICREYSTDNCDYHSGDYGWEAHLLCPEHLEEYQRKLALEARVEKKERQRKKSKQGRAGVKVKKGRYVRKARKPVFDYAGMLTDIARVPLPVLPKGDSTGTAAAKAPGDVAPKGKRRAGRRDRPMATTNGQPA